ncbi:NUDIX hydrolase [Nocardioides sp. Y6]|uniref:NUDIX hydrolase n=1 Tax=Nocardioides malaquae TaxID=2773426 RepID=A0ABR9RR40_9ACTN|nr:NUDIX hydrolase [Nocardioides malaquae]
MLHWRTDWSRGDLRETASRVAALVARGLEEHGRVEAWIDPDDEVALRVATWAGLRREGVMRGGNVIEGTHRDLVVHARLATDLPLSAPGGFRALLNSFLPRKRAIGQMLVRDRAGRVLMCELTYKPDWDLPGGVIEVGESPAMGVTREIEEELAVHIPAHRLLLTDWLPAWSGWDDALCLVFDGGVHDASLLDRMVREEREIRAVRFCTLEEIRAHSADFTARRVEAALASLEGGPLFTESGRPLPDS